MIHSASPHTQPAVKFLDGRTLYVKIGSLQAGTVVGLVDQKSTEIKVTHLASWYIVCHYSCIRRL